MPGRLIVDLDALAVNYARFQAAAVDREVGAVVKADAYGLGVVPVARRLQAAGCRSFFVATAAEGVRLRTALNASSTAARRTQDTIYVFEGALPDTVQSLVDAKLTPILNHPGQLDAWRPHRHLPIAAQVDTGMARMGFAADLSPSVVEGFELRLLLTHLACSDVPDHPANQAQVARFAEVAARFPGVPTSIGNSGGWLSGAATQGDLGRPGIGLFGGNPFSDRVNPMATVVRFEGQVLQLRRLAADTPVGYGQAAVTRRVTDTAVVGIGYADGVKRSLSQQGAMMVAGRRCPILGRISMDLTVLDVTDLVADGGAAEVGMWVECFGEHLTVDAVAGQAGTIAFEMFTGIGPRVARHYLGAEAAGASTYSTS